MILIRLTCGIPAAYCQSVSRLQYYDVSAGLPSNHLYKIVQDKKGFLWIATENGISRFDGHNFKNFSVREGLIDNDVINIFLDAVGNIWFIPFAGRPFYYDINKEQLVNEKTTTDLIKIRSRKYISGHSNADSSVSFYDEANVYVFKNNRLVTSKKITEVTGGSLVYFTVLFGKKLLVFSDGLIYELHKNELVFMGKVPYSNLTRAGSTEFENSITINTTSNQIVKFSISGDSKVINTVLSALGESHANTSFLDNSIALAASNQFIYFLNKNDLQLENFIETKSDNMHVFEDKEKNIWVATADRGLIKITNPSIKDYVIPYPKSKQIQTVYESKQGIVAGNSMGGIFISNKGKWNHVPKTSSGFKNHYLKRMVSSGNKTFVGGAFCFLYFFNKDYIPRRTHLSKTITAGVKDLYVYEDSILYVGSVGRLVKININTWEETILDSVRSSCITIDNKGRLYRGSKTGVSIFENNKLMLTESYDPSFSVNFIRFASSPDGIVWGGTSNDTLYAFKDLKVIKKITFSDRNFGSLCKGLQSVRPGELWYASDNGLIKINYKISNDGLTYSSISFGNNEGLGNSTINDIYIFNDSISIATNDGVKRLSINALPIINNIPTYLTEILLNSLSQKFSDNMILSNSSEYLQLIYTTIDFDGAMPKIQYKINDAKWQNLNGSNLTLNNMKPGSYIILARAINKNGKPSTIVNKFILTVESPFWKKTWFILLLFVLAITVSIQLLQRRNKIRLARQNAQNIAIALQREKITADLHDDIGASLSSVQINSAVAARLFYSNPKESKLLLNKLEKQSQNLSERIGDFIWSMKPGKDEFLNIGDRIRNYAAEILNAKNITFKINVTDNADKLLVDFDVRKNILLIAKEAINNAAKYSDGNKVWVELYEDGKNIMLIINDDGRGIDTNKTTGNGLSNMTRRAHELSGELKILNLKPTGASIVAVIPIANIKEKNPF